MYPHKRKFCDLPMPTEELAAAVFVPHNDAPDAGAVWIMHAKCAEAFQRSRDLLANPPTAPSAKKRGEKRQLGHFRDPPGLLIKCILNVLIKQNRDRAWILQQFKLLVPEYNGLLKRPVSDNALLCRADTGVRPGYEREHPDKQPEAMRYMPAAQAIVAAGVPVTKGQFLDWVRRPEEGKAAPPKSATKAPKAAKASTPRKRKAKEPTPTTAWTPRKSIYPEPGEPPEPGKPGDFDDEDDDELARAGLLPREEIQAGI
jgi:hypothetical protein